MTKFNYKWYEVFLPGLRLKRIERELNAEEREGTANMYFEYWPNWARNKLEEFKKPSILSTLIKQKVK